MDTYEEILPEHCLWVWALVHALNHCQTDEPDRPQDTATLFRHAKSDIDTLALAINKITLFGQLVTPGEWDVLCYLFLKKLKEQFALKHPPLP